MTSLHPHLGVIVFLLCLVSLRFLCWAADARAADSPRAALVQAQRGIDEANADLFNAVVDVASIVDRASEVVIAVFREQALRSGSGPGAPGGGAMAVLPMLAASAQSPGQISLLKQILGTEVRNFVVTGVNGGYFAGKPDPSVAPSRNSLAGALRKMPVGRREIVPGKLLSQQDTKARMSATLNDPAAGSLPLVLVLEQHKEGWRVMEIANVKELIHEATKERK